MATLDETLLEIQIQQDTLRFIISMLDFISPTQVNFSTECGYDSDRIDSIREFLETEQAEVEAKISCLFGLNVSGTC